MPSPSGPRRPATTGKMVGPSAIAAVTPVEGGLVRRCDAWTAGASPTPPAVPPPSTNRGRPRRRVGGRAAAAAASAPAPESSVPTAIDDEGDGHVVVAVGGGRDGTVDRRRAGDAPGSEDGTGTGTGHGCCDAAAAAARAAGSRRRGVDGEGGDGRPPAPPPRPPHCHRRAATRWPPPCGPQRRRWDKARGGKWGAGRRGERNTETGEEGLATTTTTAAVAAAASRRRSSGRGGRNGRSHGTPRNTDRGTGMQDGGGGMQQQKGGRGSKGRWNRMWEGNSGGRGTPPQRRRERSDVP